MCGITGFLDPTTSTQTEKFQKILNSMGEAIIHRGPDDSGTWIDAQAGVGLGFRRLAILDLTPSGHQPMISSDGRYVMVFNGEVYNFASLKDELSMLGHSFQGRSDSEVMLAAISQWGLKPALQRFNGMFAFCLWDRKLRQLHLVRDRVGIKPLYYGWLGGDQLVFGSELKALRAHPGFLGKVDRTALTLYLRNNYIPAPWTIYEGINKLPPGSILTFSIGQPPASEKIEPYWSMQNVAEQGLANPFVGEEGDAIEQLDAQLRKSIGLRMIADVPLGALLSGGVDSSTVAALMQGQSSLPVKTFSVGFTEQGFDEAPYARQVAQHLGTEHTEIYVTPEEARQVIPMLPRMYDEPFADPSQIPTHLISRIARQQVTVSLSGDGGDELFAGYNRYVWAMRLWRRTGWLPGFLRRVPARLIRSIPPAGWEAFLHSAGRLIPSLRDLPNLADKVLRTAGILEAGSPQAVYLNLVSQWKDPAAIVINGMEPANFSSGSFFHLEHGSDIERMMLCDMLTYLPDDILTKVDRASMAVSLELRAPLLDDHETIEFAWSLPIHLKIRQGQGKWILRQVLAKYVPVKIFDRPKMGFGVPIHTWLRGPLRDWAAALLEEERLKREGFFHPELIQKKWSQHLAGSHNWQYDLWSVLMFQAWLEAGG